MTSKTRSRIAVVCPCGKKYRCSYKRIGKSVTCRSCGQKMDVVEPTVPTDAELLETDSATGPPSNNQTLRILGIILLLLAVLASMIFMDWLLVVVFPMAMSWVLAAAGPNPYSTMNELAINSLVSLTGKILSGSVSVTAVRCYRT